jgi:hypothetical protein
MNSHDLPIPIISILGGITAAFCVFSTLVSWHYRDKYNDLNAFKPPNIIPTTSIPATPVLLSGNSAYTFFNSDASNINPTFDVVALNGQVQVSRLKVTNYGSFKGNTLVCPAVSPGTVPTYSAETNAITSSEPSRACPTAPLNTLFVWPSNVANNFNLYNENFWCPNPSTGKRPIFSNFDGAAQTLTLKVWTGSSTKTYDYIPYWFINVDEWSELNPPRKYFSASCGGQVFFNSTGHEIIYTLDNDANQGGYPPSRVFGGPVTFVLKNGDSIFIEGNLFVRYIETTLTKSDGSPL